MNVIDRALVDFARPCDAVNSECRRPKPCEYVVVATVGKQSIVVGSTRIVGEASVDGGGVRGEGGAQRPRLIIPLRLQVNPMPEVSAIAVTEVRADLTTSSAPGQGLQLGASVTQSLMHGFPARSLPSGPLDHTAYLSFTIDQHSLAAVEAWRHGTDDDVVTLHLHLAPTIAAISTAGQVRPGEQLVSKFEPSFGMYSTVEPFWYADISPLAVAIEQSVWVRNVLPGLGHDRTRLIEFELPPSLPGHVGAGVQFDKARRALDERRYGDCIEACRGILNMWESEWDASRKVRIVEQVAADRSWALDDIRRTFLDEVWRRTGDVANAPHHPEGDTDSELFDARDAQMILMTTVVLSHYVAR